MPRLLAIWLLVGTLLLGGCASIRDAAIRGRLMDHRFQRRLLPALLDSYRMKMENDVRSPRPAEPVPDGIDRG